MGELSGVVSRYLEVCVVPGIVKCRDCAKVFNACSTGPIHMRCDTCLPRPYWLSRMTAAGSVHSASSRAIADAVIRQGYVAADGYSALMEPGIYQLASSNSNTTVVVSFLALLANLSI